MLPENPNDSFHWKSKLDHLDHLPGEQKPDKGHAWEKLHVRLEKKPFVKMTAWYWTSAACLLLVLGIYWLIIETKSNDLLIHNKQEQPEKPVITFNPFKDGNVAPSYPETDRQPLITTLAKNKKRYPTIKKTVAVIKPVVRNIAVANMLTPEVYNTSPIPDTIAVIETVLVKKRLRVVHVNELGRPVEDQIQLARNNARPLRRKARHQDTFSNIAVSNNSSHEFIKIKLPLSN